MADQQGPSSEDIARQEELNRLKGENNRLEQQAREAQRDQAAISNGLIDDLKEVLGIRSRTTQAEKQTLKLNTDINNAVNKQVTGFGSVKSLTKDIEKNQKLISQATNQTRGIEENLSKTQTKRLNAARNLADEITNQNDKVEEMQATMLRGEAIDQKELKAEKEKLVGLDEQFATLQKNLSTEAQQVLLTEQQQKALEKVTAEMAKELELQKKIENSFGVFGGVAKALGELPVVGKAFTGALSNAKGRVAEIAKETGEIPSKFQRANIFAQEFSGIVAKASLAFIVQQALALNKGLVEVGRTLGISKSEIKSINQELRDTEAASGNVFTTDSERLGTLNRISKTLGMNAKILGVENVAGAARLEQSLGLAAEAADGLATLSALSGDEILNVSDNVYELTSEFNNTNKTAFNGKNILEEVGKTSKSIGALFAFNTTELTKATLEAKKLGLSLEQVNGIAGNLLQFEDSITAELEAELFLGQDINLEKARQLALTNDLGGLSKELANNEAVRQAFASKNRFTIEKTAKALGMSVENMSQMFYQQELNNMSAEQFDATYGQQNRKAAEQLTIQQDMEKALARLAEAATPFVELIADLLSHTTAISAIFGLMAGVQMAKLASSFGPVISKALTYLSVQTATATAATASATAVSFGAMVPVILGAIAAIGGAIYAYQKVSDGMAPASKGPFTITDNFGATAITAEGDGIAVSPNISRKSSPDQGEERLATGGGTANIDMTPVVKAINELKALIATPGAVNLDGQKVGEVLKLGSYNLGK